MRRLFASLLMLGSPLMALPEYATLQDALPVAQKEQRSIMLNFTGTDWCTACIHLRTKIIDSAEFETAMGDKLLLVEVDYPRTPALVNKISPEERQKRENMLVSYRAQGLPYAVLMDENGYPFATLPGASRTTADYLKRVEEALSIRDARDAELAKAAKLTGMEAAKAMVAALELLPEPCRDKYPELLQRIASIDTEDTLGYRKYCGGTQARIEQMNKLRAILDTFRGDFAPESLHANIKALDEFLATPNLDPDVRQQALRTKSDSYAFLRDIPMMLKTMKEARDANPESRLGKKLTENIKYTEEKLLPAMQAEQNAAEQK